MTLQQLGSFPSLTDLKLVISVNSFVALLGLLNRLLHQPFVPVVVSLTICQPGYQVEKGTYKFNTPPSPRICLVQLEVFWICLHFHCPQKELQREVIITIISLPPIPSGDLSLPKGVGDFTTLPNSRIIPCLQYHHMPQCT